MIPEYLTNWDLSGEKTMSNNERIDFESIYYEEKQGSLELWTNKVARLVEEQTIQRCQEYSDSGDYFITSIPRLYAQPEEKGAHNVEG